MVNSFIILVYKQERDVNCTFPDTFTLHEKNLDKFNSVVCQEHLLYGPSVLPNRNHYSNRALYRECDVTGAIFTHPSFDLILRGPR